jgi:NADH-quinone oxidoreductase subunit C
MVAETEQQQQEQQRAPADPTAAFVHERFADELLEVAAHRGETTLVLRPEAIATVCLALRDAPTLRYNFLADLTAVDWPERDPRFDVVYHLLSLETRAVVRLKVRVGAPDEEVPAVPSVTTVWPTADWYEREIYDLFGISFTGHPSLRRILMPEDWEGYPLRKDYPLTGIALPEPRWGGQVPLDQPLPPGTGQQTLRTDNAAPAPAPTPATDGPDRAPDTNRPRNPRRRS